MMPATLMLLASLWTADFERQAVSPASIVGEHPVRFTVTQGDNPLGDVGGRRATGDRAELSRRVLEGEGEERVYHWRTRFPHDFPATVPTAADPYTWTIFAQWHHEGRTGSPPLYFQALGDRVTLATNRRGSTGEWHGGPVHWSAPMARGAWHEFELRVRWSEDPAKGTIALRHNGAEALPEKRLATLMPGQRNYFKLGLYRSAKIPGTATVYHDVLSIR